MSAPTAKPSAAREPLPTGIRLTALDETYREHPHDILDRLRAEDPVHRDRDLGRVFLTRHDDVRAVLRDKNTNVDPRSALPDSYVRLITRCPVDAEEEFEPSMLFSNEPEHRRLRALVSQAFNPRAIDAIRPRIAEIAEQLLDDMASHRNADGEVDFIAAFAAPLPTIVIADMLGVDASRRSEFKRWSDDIVLGFDPLKDAATTARIDASGEAMRAFFRSIIAERRKSPGTDLISDLIRAEEEGHHLTNDEILSMCTLLLTAGNVTTTDLIGNGVYALLTHPAELAKLKADPGRIENAVEEMLRYDSPVTDSGRLPASDIEIGGCPIEKGRSITTSLAAANHDPAVYPEPHRFDIDRADTHHHAFGGGARICLGAPLARVEAQIGINALLARFPDLQLGNGPARRRHLPSFRGFEVLHVRL